jgi:hypothetical protein
MANPNMKGDIGDYARDYRRAVPSDYYSGDRIMNWEIRVGISLSGGSVPTWTRVNANREAIYRDGTVMPDYMQMSQKELAQSDRDVNQFYGYMRRLHP